MKPNATSPAGFRSLLSILVLASALTLVASAARAESAQELNTRVNETLKQFYQEVNGGQKFLKSARGVLVFPSVIKAGVGIGGEYGEGALRVKGKTVAYYNTAGASFGLQLGAQSRSVIIAFMTPQALENFRNSPGWTAGVDGSIAVAQVGAGGSIDTTKMHGPIVGFVFGEKGLMGNLTLEGSKFTKIDKAAS